MKNALSRILCIFLTDKPKNFIISIQSDAFIIDIEYQLIFTTMNFFRNECISKIFCFEKKSYESMICGSKLSCESVTSIRLLSGNISSNTSTIQRLLAFQHIDFVICPRSQWILLDLEVLDWELFESQPARATFLPKRSSPPLLFLAIQSILNAFSVPCRVFSMLKWELEFKPSIYLSISHPLVRVIKERK